MTDPLKRRPLSEWSEEELLLTLSDHRRIAVELDALIDEWVAATHSQQTALSDVEELADAANDPHIAELIRTREEAALSVKEIKQELQRRKIK